MDGPFSAYTISVTDETITPDPADDASKNQNFLNLIALRAACMIDTGNARINSAKGLLVKDDKITVDLRDKATNALALLQNGYCAFYERVLTQYLNDYTTSLAVAVMTPFRTLAYDYGYGVDFSRDFL